MSDNTYNGWTNYETWLCKLWIDTDQGSLEYWEEQARESARIEEDMADTVSSLAKTLRNEFEEASPEVTGFYADVINAALRSVNWLEIAESIVYDAGIEFDQVEEEEIEDPLEISAANVREMTDDQLLEIIHVGYCGEIQRKTYKKACDEYDSRHPDTK